MNHTLASLVYPITLSLLAVATGARVWIRYRRDRTELDGGDAYGNTGRHRRDP